MKSKIQKYLSLLYLFIGRPMVSLVVVVFLLALYSEAGAQDPLELEETTVQTPADQWGLALTPYAWFAAQSSDVGGKALRQSFNDLASITNVGFQMRTLARWRWILFTADWTYANQKSETVIWRTSIDMKLNQHILDMKIGGKVYDSRTPEQNGGMGIWVAAGARYWDNEVEFSTKTEPILPGGTPDLDTTKTGQTWWDPVLGIAMHFPVTPEVGFLVRATGGGLGIGNASSYLWDAEFVALFRLSRRFMISAGYRQFKYDRKDGSGDDEVRQTVTVTGPEIGLSIGIF